ncbi:MAG: hypothetical protein BRD40_01315 [Bacteroidetes bacterium QS_1_65_9]|nr:MAG: hypothetical protein BRD40_01315 [Bacteroidetes bacterium QS_1_65_9]
MLFVFLAAANGLMTVLSRMVNAALGSAVGSLRGSFVNHTVGTLTAGALLLAGLRMGAFRLTGIPWIYFIGGCLGVLVVAASNYAVRHVGAALFATLLLTGQLFTSAVIDHFGLLGKVRIAATPGRRAVSGLLKSPPSRLTVQEIKRDCPANNQPTRNQQPGASFGQQWREAPRFACRGPLMACFFFLSHLTR